MPYPNVPDDPPGSEAFDRGRQLHDSTQAAQAAAAQADADRAAQLQRLQSKRSGSSPTGSYPAVPRISFISRIKAFFLAVFVIVGVMTIAVVVVSLWIGDPKPPAAADPAEVVGTWDGSYTCSQGPTALHLVIKKASEGAVTATLTFHTLKGARHVPEGTYTLHGTYTTEGLNLVPDRWIKHPAGYQMIALTSSRPSHSTLTGQFRASCGSFKAKRS